MKWRFSIESSKMGKDAYILKGSAVAFCLENFSLQDQKEFHSAFRQVHEEFLFTCDLYQEEHFYVVWVSKPETLFSWAESKMRRPTVLRGNFHRLNPIDIRKCYGDDSLTPFSVHLDDLNRFENEKVYSCLYEERNWFDDKNYLSHQVVDKLFTLLTEKGLGDFIPIFQRNKEQLFPGEWLFYYTT